MPETEDGGWNLDDREVDLDYYHYGPKRGRKIRKKKDKKAVPDRPEDLNGGDHGSL